MKPATGALAGAAIGTAIAPGVGTVIGAAIGFLAGNDPPSHAENMRRLDAEREGKRKRDDELGRQARQEEGDYIRRHRRELNEEFPSTTFDPEYPPAPNTAASRLLEGFQDRRLGRPSRRGCE